MPLWTIAQNIPLHFSHRTDNFLTAEVLGTRQVNVLHSEQNFEGFITDGFVNFNFMLLKVTLHFLTTLLTTLSYLFLISVIERSRFYQPIYNFKPDLVFSYGINLKLLFFIF